MTAQIAYWMALGALVLLITFRGPGPMKRTVYTLLVVGLVGLLLAEQMPFPGLRWPTENWALIMMAVDTLGAIVILIRPAGKTQALIGLTFLLQIGVHAGRILNGDSADLDIYWWGLSIPAVLQLVLTGGWWVNEQFIRPRAVHRVGPVAAGAHRKGMGG